MDDYVLPILAFMGCGFLATAFASQIFSSFIALNATPFRRAAWTAGLAYWVATAAIMAWAVTLSVPDEVDPRLSPYAAPLYCLPSGLLALLFWYREFRRTWVPDERHVPKGARLMNSDWRAGLRYVVLLFVGAALATLWRWLLRAI